MAGTLSGLSVTEIAAAIHQAKDDISAIRAYAAAVLALSMYIGPAETPFHDHPVYWTYLSNLRDEITLIWPSKPSLTKYLFFVVRCIVDYS